MLLNFLKKMIQGVFYKVVTLLILTDMASTIIATCAGFVLGATLLITVALEIGKYDGLYNGSLVESIWQSYKLHLLQVFYSLLWIGGIALAIELMLTVYDGARMRYRLRIEFFERLEDFYCRQLPQMTLVYTKTPAPTPALPAAPPVAHEPILHIEHPPAATGANATGAAAAQPPILYAEEPVPPPVRRQSTRRRRSVY
jgi:hypothetical protein